MAKSIMGKISERIEKKKGQYQVSETPEPSASTDSTSKEVVVKEKETVKEIAAKKEAVEKAAAITAAVLAFEERKVIKEAAKLRRTASFASNAERIMKEIIELIDDDESEDEDDLPDERGEEAEDHELPTARDTFRGRQEKLKLDISDKDYMQKLRVYTELGCCVGDLPYKDLQASKINFARNFFIIQQLNACFVESKSELQKIVDDFRKESGGKASWPLEVTHELLEKGVHELCMKPFESIVLNGKAQDYFEHVPEICNLLSHFQRDKVVRSLIVLYGQYNNHVNERPDLLRTYFRYCCSSNDNFIENYNSLIEGGLPSTATITEEQVAKSSSIVVIKHNLMTTKKQAADPNHKPDSEREGEIRIEEKKATTASAKLDRDTELIPWLKSHYSRLGKIEPVNAR